MSGNTIIHVTRHSPAFPKVRSTVIPIKTPTWITEEPKTEIKATWLGYAYFLIKLPRYQGEAYWSCTIQCSTFSDRCPPGRRCPLYWLYVFPFSSTFIDLLLRLDCTLNFVWFEDLCEDAITIKNDEYGDYTNIIGGGTYHAEDKIVQHNGCGTVNIINFYAEDYGKLYRSWGNCKSQCYRTVYIKGIVAVDGGTIAGINYNYGHSATILDSCYDTSHPCTLYDGCNDVCEPEVIDYCSG
ncbi:pectate lyase-domain-containing protein [Armillaria nabsnona]|nr:pectate lyase-domain-containing protein [Armillaria nabsnona]